MEQSQNASYQAGQAKGQAQEKGSGMIEKASGVAQGAKDSCHEATEQMKATAQGAADAVKTGVGAHK